MVDFLAENPLLLLFLVVAVGYPVGRIKVRGVSLGVASVLFAGLGIGAIDERLRLPDVIFELGLVLFVYTVGLSTGRGFISSLRRHGAANAAWVAGSLAVAASFVIGAWAALDLSAGEAGGIFAGSLTNTPALAGVLEYLSDRAATSDAALADPVIAYSITYPMSVIGTILAIVTLQRAWKIDYRQEAAQARATGFAAAAGPLSSRTITVTNPAVHGESLDDLAHAHGWKVIFGRLKRGDDLALVTGETRLAPGDLVSLIGEAGDLDRATAYLGQPSEDHLEFSREEIDYRRLFVSNPAIAGRPLREVHLPRRFDAIVTRVSRGDTEFLPDGGTVLELGDRVRVVTRRERIDDVTALFGDSYRSLSEIDILTFSLGIALGLAAGQVPLPLPGDITIELGMAGGPLLVALLLGWRDRTGPFIWTLPYNANLTLRQIGLILFLAGVGTRAGFAFRGTFSDLHGITIFVAGAALTGLVATFALWSARRLLKVPMGIATGALAGLQTQPAVLGFALEQAGDDLPNTGYAAVYPLATIAKIVIAQILVAILV